MDVFRKTKSGMNTSNWTGIWEDQIGSIDVKLDRLYEDPRIFGKIRLGWDWADFRAFLEIFKKIRVLRMFGFRIRKY